MDYTDIRPHLRQYIHEDIYNNSPDMAKPFLIMMAEDNHSKNQRNITHSTIETSNMSHVYKHDESPSFMNFINHRYTLVDDDEPTRAEFITIVRYYLHLLSSIPRYRVRNITVRYDTSDGCIRWLSFSRSNIDTMGLDRLLDHMVCGENDWEDDFFGGSDMIRNYFYNRSLNFVRFFIITETIEGGMREVEYDYYKCIETAHDHDGDNNCLIDCFRYFSKDVRMDPSKVRCLLGVDQNTMLTIEHVPLLERLFNVNVGVYEDRRLIEFRYKSGKHYFDHQTIIKKDYPVMLYGILNTPHKILWKDNHFSIITSEYMARHCHCEHTGAFVGYGKRLIKDEIIEILRRQGRIDTDESTIGDEQDITTYYYFFDYETIYEKDTMELMPYAWSVVKYNNDGELQQIWNEVTSNPKELKSITDVLFKESPRSDERKYLIGFNNSRFDNYFLLQECQHNNIRVKNVYFAGNSIIGMNIQGFVVRDLCRIVCTSLQNACKSFKCNIGKGELNHVEIQDSYFRGEVFDEDKIREYVIRDCTSLGELYFKCRKEFQYLIGANVAHYNTIASMSYKSFQHMCPVDHYDYPILDQNTNEFVRQSIYGGRAQIFQTCEVKHEPLIPIDCVSLYPYVMIHRRYPIGQPIITDTYVPDKIGVYRCVIKHQPKRNIIPRRNTPLDWNYPGVIDDAVLNSVDIECIRRHGGECEVIVGYYWKDDRDDIFEYYFRSIVEEKYKQDSYKNTSEYNHALREVCKLLMNSLSGKLQQRLFENHIELIQNNEDLRDFMTKVVNNSETFTPFGSWYITQGKKLNIRPKMPTIWGSLILSYARSYMYDEILSKIDRIYGMDTDSVFIHDKDIPRHLIGIQLGEFKEELRDEMCDDGDEGPFGVFVAPKCYCFYKRNKNGIEIPIKMRFKGVNVNNDIVVDKNILNVNVKDLHNIYWNGKNKISIETFRQLLNANVYILCSSLEKRLTDSMGNVLKINHRFVVKKIDRHNIDGIEIPT